MSTAFGWFVAACYLVLFIIQQRRRTMRVRQRSAPASTAVPVKTRPIPRHAVLGHVFRSAGTKLRV